MSKLRDAERDLVEAKKNLRRSVIILILAFFLWPLGLFIHPWASFLIFFVLAALGGVSTYISFMHKIAAQNKIDDR